MAFVDITATDGVVAHLDAATVFRIITGAGGPAGSTLVNAGGIHVFTAMGVRAAANLVNGGGGQLTEFTAPDMSPVFMRLAAISEVQAADPYWNPPGSNAVVTVSGQSQAVNQTVQQVEAMIAGGH